ncbi:MAG: hypothetical protein M3458_20800 [Acidobacteriota bacterium]|nr:hypothetical protein [Acidobacteriota bacterium]
MSDKLSYEHINRRVSIGFDADKKFGILLGFSLDRKVAYVELEDRDPRRRKRFQVPAYKVALAPGVAQVEPEKAKGA